ncbi:MAG: response regulator [Gammaproteobacteria bacterium]|nr:response regulator [Gammaproteobacteria bacterium]
MSYTPTILAVDDNAVNLSLIESQIEFLNINHHFKTAENGLIAWQMLLENPSEYDVVLLDRMMPEMTGIELLQKIKNDKRLKHINVILQTAMSKREDIIEGMNAGAFYYLTKPLDIEIVEPVLRSALDDCLQYKSLLDSLKETNKCLTKLSNARFEFQTLDEANTIAAFIANICPCPESVVNGLAELMINAVEHGNLEISYAEKSELKATNRWRDEIEHRLKLPEYESRIASVGITNNQHGITFTITDEGDGFDWQDYMDFSPERMSDSHGRGIAVANNLSFSKVEYKNTGNIVEATVNK